MGSTVPQGVYEACPARCAVFVELTGVFSVEKLVLTGVLTPMKSIILASSLLFGFAACGGSDLDPGSGDDPGSGTSTLTVNGSISAQARLSNAHDPAEFDTEISVRIQLAGQNVTTGSVMVTSSSGTVVLAYNPDNGGRWRGTAPRHREGYRLRVGRRP